MFPLAVKRSSVPSIFKAALSSSPVPDTNVYVKVSPASTSVVDKIPKVPLAPEFSSRVGLLRSMSVGASFTLLMVKTNTSSTHRPPASVERMRTE